MVLLLRNETGNTNSGPSEDLSSGAGKHRFQIMRKNGENGLPEIIFSTNVKELIIKADYWNAQAEPCS